MIEILLLLILSLLLLLISNYWYYSTKRPTNYPPGPKWLPFIGNTSLLRNKTKQLNGQHFVFKEWMKKYNSPVIGLKLGGEYVVVALTYPMVREIHTRDEFDGRPDNFFFRIRTMGTRLGITSTDGPLWIEHRNFAIKHLRQAGFGRHAMDIQIHNELLELINVITNYNEKPIWPGEFLSASVINVLWIFATGTRIDEKRLAYLLVLMQKRAKAFDMAGGIISQLPWLRFIAPEKTGFNLINKLNKEFYDLFLETINEHKLNYTDDKSTDDLIYAFIKEQRLQENDPKSTFTDIQLIMIIIDLFIAGSQTTSTTLNLAFMIMALKPNIQECVYNELNKQLNNVIPLSASTSPSSSSFSALNLHDRTQFPYINAVLMEVQRFFNILPITGPRRTLCTTNLGGYQIPKNTTILIGLHSVHMDPDYWDDPNEFRPERFLDEQLNVINTERLMPFGQGKRKCLGEILARSCLLRFFAGVLQTFQICAVNNGESLPSLNLIPGIMLTPKPYKVLFKRR